MYISVQPTVQPYMPRVNLGDRLHEPTYTCHMTVFMHFSFYDILYYYSLNTCCPLVIVCVSYLAYGLYHTQREMNGFQPFGIYHPKMAINHLFIGFGINTHLPFMYTQKMDNRYAKSSKHINANNIHFTRNSKTGIKA